MKILVDTHVFIWLASDTSRLSAPALAALSSPANDMWLSDASIWEMAIKVGLGKLSFPEPFNQRIIEAVRRSGVNVLPISTRHVAAVASLPAHHRDPFDRLLVVQAMMEGCVLVTHDSQIAPYGIQVIW